MNSQPESVKLLRGVGPRVFVSYSFRDRALADIIAGDLRRMGMQVRLEDETSLLGSRLDAVLPQRIGESEVFIQLITETSAQSVWVAREFEWAAGEQGGPLVILPLIVDGAVPPGPISTWAYLPVSSNVDPSTLDLIRRAAMRSVAVLPLDRAVPYQLDEESLRQCVANEEMRGKRVIVDADGLLLRMVRATVVNALNSEVAYKDQVVIQQDTAYQRLRRKLQVLDLFCEGFVANVRLVAAGHWSPEDWVAECGRIVQTFVRLTLGRVVLDLVSDWSAAISDEISPNALAQCRSAIATADLLQKDMPSYVDGGLVLWALGTPPGRTWLDLGLEGRQGISGGHLYLPADHFDEIGVASLTTSVNPAAEVTTTDWLTLGLPQVAARAVPAVAHDVAESLDSIGWSISDYVRCGAY